MISFSIICATKNEEQDVRIALESCVRQTYKADEIFFVDDSTDGTKDIIRQYHSRGVTLVDGDGHGCCQARNKAMELSSSDVIVFTNADIDLPVDYLERLSDIYENPLIDIVIPDSHVKNMDTIYARYVHYLDLADKVGRNSWTAQGYSVRRNSAKEAGWISGGIYPSISAETGHWAPKCRAIIATSSPCIVFRCRMSVLTILMNSGLSGPQEA